LTQTLFLNIILRKILKKKYLELKKNIIKTRDFRKKICCHSGCFMRSKNKQLI
jgi:hypothetical protein